MHGIVIWADIDAYKAVIWCSDHGDLAYATGEDCLFGTFSMPEEGTMVACEAHMENGMRICSKITPIQRFAAPELAQSLRDMADEYAA